MTLDPLAPKVLARHAAREFDPEKQCALMEFARHWLKKYHQAPKDSEVRAAFAWAASGSELAKCR